ncbi:MAG TPA: hypothetical protein VFR15_11705 [Chloroflexia bacterium]|nr:hypothetical protein [Chloroflexia bacterium]
MVPVRLRLPLLALGGLALVTGMWLGLVRLGWGLYGPGLPPSLPAMHGALMVGSFFGTLIGLERAVALGRRWAYLAPLLSGLSGVALLVGLPREVGAVLLSLSSLMLVAIYAVVLRMQFALFTVTMALGAVAWLGGNLLWLSGRPVYGLVYWWAGFLVLTIAGERLELSRVLRLGSRARAAFAGAMALFGVGLLLSTFAADAGARVAGLGLLALSLWLGLNDVARRTVRQKGLTRFIAVSLLLGYVWLGVGGVLAAVFGELSAGPRYDAVLHCLFLGFVFSMVFAHAPIILPAVTGAAVPYRPLFYAHLALLHASLVVRVAGDLTGWADGRQWGGMANVAAVVLFVASTAWAVATARRAKSEGRSRRYDSLPGTP